MIEALLIPEERAGVLTAEVRERLEKEADVKMKVQGNSIMLEGEGLQMLAAKNFIKAVGRGFSPERAWKLLGEDITLDLIELGGFNERRQQQIKARVIGSGGRMRGRIEEKTGAALSVYGKTIAIIGTWEQAQRARGAVEMIIKGTEMSTVSRWLQRL